MDALSIKERFLQSLERCERNEGFLPSFYARFVSSSELVKSKFRNTNFEQQNQKLIRSLRLVAGVTSSQLESLHELRLRAETHDRSHLDIQPELYEYWHEALVSTAAQTDPAWDEDIERAWNTILDSVVNHMVKHY